MARKTLDEKELLLKERERTINALEQKYKAQEAKIKKDHEAFSYKTAEYRKSLLWIGSYGKSDL